MNEITINSFIDYLSYVEKNYTRNHIFRGMNHLNYFGSLTVEYQEKYLQVL